MLRLKARPLSAAVIAVAGALLVATGCGSDDEPALPQREAGTKKDPRPPAPSSTKEDASLEGTYRARVKHDPANRLQGGVWRLTLAGDRATVTEPREGKEKRRAPQDLGSPISIKKGALYLRPARVCVRRATARYAFESSDGGRRLTFSRGRDRCDFRTALLVRTWRATGRSTDEDPRR